MDTHPRPLHGLQNETIVRIKNKAAVIELLRDVPAGMSRAELA